MKGFGCLVWTVWPRYVSPEHESCESARPVDGLALPCEGPESQMSQNQKFFRKLSMTACMVEGVCLDRRVLKALERLFTTV